MKSKKRFIPLVIIGAILVSLLVALPAFAERGTIRFVDPIDSDDDALFTNQGGPFTLELEDDDLNVPTKFVLLSSDIDEVQVSTTTADAVEVTVDAHSATIETTAQTDWTVAVDNNGKSTNEVERGDTIILGGLGQTVREVVSVTDFTPANNGPDEMAGTDDDVEAIPASIVVNKVFGLAITSPVSISEVINSDAEYDECATCAMAQTHMFPAGNTFADFNLQNVPVDSGVGAGRDSTDANVGTTANRLSNNEDTRLTANDVLLINASDEVVIARNLTGNEGVTVDLPSVATSTTYTVIYWGAVINNTGNLVTMTSSADTGQTIVLQETGPDTGLFTAEVQTKKKEDDAPAENTLPVLDVTANDLVRVTYDDADPGTPRASIDVESNDPTFSNLSPDHGVSGRDTRRDISADVSDGTGSKTSGVDEDVIFLIFASAAPRSGTLGAVEALDDIRIRETDNGFSATGRPSRSLIGDDDATVYWWVVSKDLAGNIAVSDRQDTKEWLITGVQPDFLTTGPGPDGILGTVDDLTVPHPAAGDNIYKEVADGLSAELSGDDALERETIADLCEPDKFWDNLITYGEEDIEVGFATPKDNVFLSDDVYKCQPYAYHVDATPPEITAAVTGSFWDEDSDEDDKTEYDADDAIATSIRVDFDEDLDAETVDRSDFRIVTIDEDGDEQRSTPTGAQVYSGKQDSVFLSVRRLDPDAAPTVELVDDVSDTAGNSSDDDSENSNDGIAPTIDVDIQGLVSTGGRTLSDGDEDVVVTITVDEPLVSANVTVYKGNRLAREDDETTKDVDESLLDEATRGSPRNAALESDGSYTYKYGGTTAGLFSVYIVATDTAGNKGTAGDRNTPISLDDDTSALLFEIDTKVSMSEDDDDAATDDDDITPNSIDDPNPFVTFDFADEGKEYTATDEDGDAADVDSHGKVTVLSATFDGNDITDQLVTTDNVKFLYRATGLAAGKYDVTIEARDEVGNEKEFEDTVEITARKPYDLALTPGWNLVSIPAEAADSDINAVIGADHPATEVRSYDPSVPGGWLFAVRSDGVFAGTLMNITSGRAYWVLTDSFEAIEVDIPRLSAGSPVAPPTVKIVKGWNMVPVQDVTESREAISAETYFSGIKVSRIYTFNTLTNSWDSVVVGATMLDDDANVVPDDYLEVGKGYWVFATEEGTLAP